MTASYPTTVKSFSTKADFTDTVVAENINTLQDEVAAIEATLGTYLKTSSGWNGSFDQVTTTWNTLKDRLNNIEYGLAYVVGDYIDLKGGSVLVPETTSTVGITVKASSGQTADLVQFQSSSSAVVSKVDSNGNIYSGGAQLVPIVYASVQPTSVPVGTIWVDSSSSPAISTATTGVPIGGTSGQALIKNSNTDYDYSWNTVNAAGSLTGNTLASNVTASSLTSVGTLTSLAVSGAVTASSFSGSGAGLTSVPTTAVAGYIHPFLVGGM